MCANVPSSSLKIFSLLICGGLVFGAFASLAAQAPAFEVASIKLVKPGQQGKPLRFEVASVKPNESGASGGTGSCHGSGDRPALVTPLGHCLFYNVSVRLLFNEAYAAERVAGYRPIFGEILNTTGWPAWCMSDRFDVDAKADDPGATKAELREMLRDLLIERFNVQFHRVSKEVSGYRLVIGKDGPRLPTADPNRPPLSPGRPQEFTSQNSPLADLQDFLSTRLGSPVVNGTNLTGNYDYTLHFRPINVDAADSDSPDGPSIFTALQEQLGLKLENTRATVVTFVIDSARRPSN